MVVKTSMDTYRQTLAGFIQDDDKLVTYKWLSKELDIHVNTAKEVLADYWERHKDDEIVATFLLIGNTKDGGKRIEVVNGADLESAKEKYEIITSQHLYSLQKGLTDIEALAIAGPGDCKYSAIKCNDNVVLTKEEMFARRWGTDIPYSAPHDGSELKPRIIPNKEPVNALKKAFSNAKPAESKENGKGKSKESSKEESKEPEKSIVKPEETKEKPKTPVKKISPPSKSGNKKDNTKSVQSTKTGFSALFGKVQNQKKSPPTSNAAKLSPEASKSPENDKPAKTLKTTTETLKKEEKFEDSMEIDFDDDFDDDFEKKPAKKSPEIEKSGKSEKKSSLKSKSPKSEEESSSKEKSSDGEEKSKDVKKSSSNDKKLAANDSSKPDKSKKPARGKKRGRSKDSHGEAKKRKRIVVMDSSEESGEESEADPLGALEVEEAVAAPSTPSPPAVRKIGGKRKVQKMVDKTFVDEDGFMVTKKVHVMESCSEDDEPPEEEEKEKKKKPSPVKETAKPKKNNKQASIMSFFKKV